MKKVMPRYYQDAYGKHRADCVGIGCSKCTIYDSSYRNEHALKELGLENSGSSCGIYLYMLLKRRRSNRGKRFKLNKRVT